MDTGLLERIAMALMKGGFYERVRQILVLNKLISASSYLQRRAEFKFILSLLTASQATVIFTSSFSSSSVSPFSQLHIGPLFRASLFHSFLSLN